VVAALAVFRLVIDHTVHYFNFTGAEVALEVGAVIPGIPQAELDRGEGREAHRLRAQVGQRQLPDLKVLAQWNEIAQGGFHA